MLTVFFEKFKTQEINTLKKRKIFSVIQTIFKRTKPFITKVIEVRDVDRLLKET